MQLTFLQAAVPLTKKYTKTQSGGYKGGAYPGVTNFTSHVEEVSTIEEFGDAISSHAAEGHCLNTSSLITPIVGAPRRKLSDKDEPRQWIMLDIDGIDVPNVEAFITSALPAPFHSASYVEQHSPSSGIKSGVRSHLFFMLESEAPPQMVRAWLKWQNLATKTLSDSLTLSDAGLALKFPLDIVPNDNGRIVYITAPECEGFSDPVPDRVQVVKKQYDLLSFNFSGVAQEKINKDHQDKVAELRDTAGLPKIAKKNYYRYEGDKVFLDKDLVQPGAITGCMEDNDLFMRCNLNGGDSWAYYYHRNNPKYLHNFKGEPSIPLEQLDKNHYDKLAKPWADKLRERDVQPFVFRSMADDKYWIGQRRGADVVTQPNQIGSQQKIDHYYTEHGMASPDPIPTWDRRFDPRSLEQYIADKKVFNTWRPTTVMKNALYRSLPPPIITKIIMHATGDDPEAYHHFINWLAYIFQNRTKTGAAWILHGCPGTGKGLITQHILPRIFGDDYCQTVQVRNLKGVHNDFIEQALFVTVDEANTEDAGQESKAIVEALKLWITERKLNFRAMNSASRQIDNFSNFIFTSNDFGVLPIQRGDRRFNVATRQETPIDISPDDIAQIKSEVNQFAGYLLGYAVDKQMAHTPLRNVAKHLIMEFKMSSIEEFVRAVQTGDLMFFIDSWDIDNPGNYEEEKITNVLKGWVADAKLDRASIMRVKELMTVYQALVSGREKSPLGKFKTNMKRHRMDEPSKLTNYDGTRIMGYRVQWVIDQEDLVTIGGHIRAVKSQEDLEKDLQAEVLASPNEQQ